MRKSITEYYVATNQGAKTLIEHVNTMSYSCNCYGFEVDKQRDMAMRVAEIQDEDARELCLEIMTEAISMANRLATAKVGFVTINETLKSILKAEVEGSPSHDQP